MRMKIINKLLSKFGYVKYDPIGELLHELMKESIRRDGKLVICHELGLKIRIQAIDILK